MSASNTDKRVRALGRAEFTLLGRNRSALAVALILPLGTVAAMRPALANAHLRGFDLNATVTSGGVGFILLFAVYYNLVTAYVARREELVLKRLRTGEPTDLEILAGTALPAIVVASVQCAVLTAAAAGLLSPGAPRRPDLMVIGVLLGIVTMAGLAAVSSVFTRTVELAQVTTAPLLLVVVLGSGMLVPLNSMPEPVRRACLLLPLASVMKLVQAGWPGSAGTGFWTLLGWTGLALAWAVVAVWSALRWFRWEPRR